MSVNPISVFILMRLVFTGTLELVCLKVFQEIVGRYGRLAPVFVLGTRHPFPNRNNIGVARISANVTNTDCLNLLAGLFALVFGKAAVIDEFFQLVLGVGLLGYGSLGSISLDDVRLYLVFPGLGFLALLALGRFGFLVAIVLTAFGYIFTAEFSLVGDFLINDFSDAFTSILEASGIQLHGMLGTDFLQKNNIILDFQDFVAYNKVQLKDKSE